MQAIARLTLALVFLTAGSTVLPSTTCASDVGASASVNERGCTTILVPEEGMKQDRVRTCTRCCSDDGHCNTYC